MSNDGIQKPFTGAARDVARPGERDLEHLRDKDNAGKDHTPRFAQYPAPNLAPHGMSGIKRGLAPEPVTDLRGETPDLAIDPDRFQPGELTDGFIPERKNVTFMAKVETENHAQGFKGGPVTFLDLRENGLTVARYDHGWVMEPKTQADRDSVQKIADTLEGFNREFKPLVPPEPDKDKDHDIDR
jgi:hypothetical protein